jgi:hypothetical protein
MDEPNHPARPEQRDSFEKGLDHKPDPPEEDLDPDFAEPVGEFAGPTEPDAPVGEFAGGPVPRGSHTGAFAGGEQRGGSFADTDRELLTSDPDGVERMRVLGHRRITRLLTDAGLDEATAKRDVDALHRGLVLVLVDVAEDDTDRVAALLKG